MISIELPAADPLPSRSRSGGPRSSSSTCSATSSSPAASARRSATTSRCCSAAVGPCAPRSARRAAPGMLVIHTREGHRPDLSDAPPAKLARGAPSKRIGDPGPMGRILVRGEPGHDIVADLYPADGRAGDRQARQGRLPPDRPRAGAAQPRHRHAARLRRDHRGLRAHDDPRGATTAAIAAWRSATPAPPTSRNSTGSASR